MRDLKYLSILMIIVAIVAPLMSAINFHDLAGNSYSPLSHFVSELGDARFSTTAWVFNSLLVAQGIIFALWFYSLYSHIKHIDSRSLAIIVATVAAISTSGVGIFNRQIQPGHKIVTTLTFVSVALVILTTTNLLITLKKLRYQWLTVGIGLTYYLLFIIGAFFYEQRYMLNVINGIDARPDIWPIAIIEWLVFAVMFLWALSISLTIKDTRNNN